MSSKKYIVIQGKIELSSHYSDIKMKSLTECQYIDAFSNESGDITIRFEGISTWLTIPWHDDIHASQSIMLFGDPISQGHSFETLFWKMKPQHLHHILHQFASKYFGDSRACLMLFIKYQQAWLDAAVPELQSLNKASALSNLFQQSMFNSDEVQQFQY
jgi:hypothetical protein